MTRVRVTHSVKIPDRLRIARYQKNPELGPSILFFSGGTAITGLSQTLKNYTHNSIHLVTPFDSGGSSAVLRDAFNMPSIGDLRSRLMALADQSVLGHPEICELFRYRFPMDEKNTVLYQRLDKLIDGEDKLIKQICNPMRSLIIHQLGYFHAAMPDGFDLRGASIGNLILTGGYLNNHQALEPIIFLFSKLVEVRGTVKAIVNDNLHMVADLEDGTLLCGQHRLTGKEVSPISSPIKQLRLSKQRDRYVPATSRIRKKSRKLIKSADLICYPPGSFYTSVLANLLPDGVAKNIAENDCPKIFIPNPDSDPEQLGMDINQSVDTLISMLHREDENIPVNQLLNFIMIDSRHGNYKGKLNIQRLKKLGITVIDISLISKQSSPYFDNEMLVNALLSLS